MVYNIPPKSIRALSEFIPLINEIREYQKRFIEDQKGSKMSVFGIWQAFGDDSMIKFSDLQSNLSMLEGEIKNMRGEDILYH